MTIIDYPKAQFGWFGLRCARLAAGKAIIAEEIAATPVHLTRYHEFSFARRCLEGKQPGRCVDVSSPRLFSAFVAATYPNVFLTMVNPYGLDLQYSREFYSAIGLNEERISYLQRYAEDISGEIDSADFLWCMSVLEHIPAPIDMSSLKEMEQLVAPGGYMILTVPASSQAHDEYRQGHVYDLPEQEATDGGPCFFQRYYDEELMESRIIDVLADSELIELELWAETCPGWFKHYEQQVLSSGTEFTCKDSWHAITKFKRVKAYSGIQGSGLACLLFRKKKSVRGAAS